ncbi:MAG: hypothetical protein WDN75_19040 [Bacteroidota bacterium]
MKANIWLLVLLAAWGCSTKKEQTSGTVTDSIAAADSLQRIAPHETIKKDKSLDALGAFMAGISQRDSNSFTQFENDTYWKEFRTSTDSNWNRLDKERFSKMKAWQGENLSTRLVDSLKVFYPFSGPDFLHVYYLYPAASDYIFAALEPIQAAPQLDTLSAALREKFLDSLSHSMRDVFNKSYFITSKMQKDIKNVKGVLPPLYFFIERTGHELLEQHFFYLDSAGSEVIIPANRLHWYKTPGVRLVFRNLATQQIKQLSYLSLNASNEGLKERPEFAKFIARNGPYNTFIKSASYLLHRAPFTEMKKIVLDNSLAIFQDDTGVPYKDLKKRLDWSIDLYGEYTMPVKEFGETRFQADLDSAYKNNPPTVDLPFSLGYHWGTKKQNYMLMRKSVIQGSK